MDFNFANEKVYHHAQDVIRELAKNCRNELYENMKIICSDGEMGMNQLMAFLVIPELHVLADQVFGERVIFLPQSSIQDLNFQIRCFFQSVTKYLQDCIQSAEIQSAQLFVQESSTVEQIINEEVLKGVDDDDLLLFDESHFSEQKLAEALAETAGFKCDECDQVFTRKSSLNRHMHTKHRRGSRSISPVQCDVCSKQVRKENLASHRRSHAAPRYPCDKCDKSFRRKFALKDHMNQHYYPNLHQCNVCDKGFHSKMNLSHHMKIHRERSFVCKECDKCFVSATKLKRHMLTHEEDTKIYQCSDCFSKFCRVDNLKKHMKKKHNIFIADLRTYRAELVKPVGEPGPVPDVGDLPAPLPHYGEHLPPQAPPSSVEPIAAAPSSSSAIELGFSMV